MTSSWRRGIRASSSTRWSKAGGDTNKRYATATVTNKAGSKVTFDVTALVQAAVRGDFGTRYTRIVLIDEGSSSQDSYKQIHSDDATTTSNRPTLTVTLGGRARAEAPSTSTSFSIVTARAAVEHPSRRLRHRRPLRHEPPGDLDREDDPGRRHAERDREVHRLGQSESARGLQEPAAVEDGQDLVLPSSRRSSGTGARTARAT